MGKAQKKDPKARYYDAGGIEVLDVIRAKLTPDQYKGWLLGNLIKYSCRANHKNQYARDVEKMDFYGTELFETLDDGGLDGRVMDLANWQDEIHKNAKAHGWWEDERPVPEILALIHSEVSEALEAYRNQDQENFAEEMADIVIRCLDAAGGYGIDIEDEIRKKHEINKSRPYRHGGKVC
jgi:NTP pyrophosphatase (non-canonical NTP hydrolase)